MSEHDIARVHLSGSSNPSAPNVDVSLHSTEAETTCLVAPLLSLFTQIPFTRELLIPFPYFREFVLDLQEILHEVVSGDENNISLNSLILAESKKCDCNDDSPQPHFTSNISLNYIDRKANPIRYKPA